MINRGVTEDGHTFHECEECSAGIHKHLDVLAEHPDWFTDPNEPLHMKVDAVDCKNRVGEGQCICRKYLEWHRRFEEQAWKGV